MKHALFFCIICLLTGCIDDAVKIGIAMHKANEESKRNPQIFYVQDLKTKLCFATTNGKDLTNVPCTNEILSEIEKQKSK